jgi:hypothetical protein
MFLLFNRGYNIYIYFMGTINFIETTKGKSIFTYSNYQATCNIFSHPQTFNYCNVFLKLSLKLQCLIHSPTDRAISEQSYL